jgi:uncharacterized protein
VNRNPQGIPVRPLGTTGVEVSIIGLGGGHICRPHNSVDDTVRIIHAAVDGGISFIDNAWEYWDGESERRFGIALAGGRREKVTLMTKVCGRDRKTAEEHLHDSLRRFQTDRIDVWQFHEVNYDNDPDWILAAEGAIEAAVAAKKAGKVRFIGFTGHKSPHIMRKMLSRSGPPVRTSDGGSFEGSEPAERSGPCDRGPDGPSGPTFPWDTCQLPMNVADSHFRSFQREVLPELNRRGIAAIGMKSLGGDAQLVTGAGLSPQECRRYALSQPISVLVCGIESLEDLEQDLAIARDFTPMSDAEQNELRVRILPHAGDGRYEWFKTTQYYDSKYHRDQHGFPPITTVRAE